MEEKTPSRIWYLISLVTFLAGLAGYIFSFLHFNEKYVTHFQQGEFPGSKIFTFEKGGKYYIFYEYDSTLHGQHYSTPQNISSDFNVQVRDSDKGQYIEYETAISESITYEIGKRKAFAIGYFKINIPGKYSIEMEYVTGKEKPRIVLAVGLSPVFSIFITLVLLLFLFLIMFLLAAIIAIIIYKKRHKKSKGTGADFV